MKFNQVFIFYLMEMRFSSIFIMLKSTGNPIFLTEGISDKYARTRECPGQ